MGHFDLKLVKAMGILGAISKKVSIVGLKRHWSQWVLVMISVWGITASGTTFRKEKITIGSHSLNVEIADTDGLREQGLMNRRALTDKEGMLFVFPSERILSFWMKNTLIPLSIGFFNSKGVLFQVLDMDPASPIELRPKVYMSARPGKFALEVPLGWFDRQKIQLGAKLKPLEFGEQKK